jgi:hypothetical protein
MLRGRHPAKQGNPADETKRLGKVKLTRKRVFRPIQQKGFILKKALKIRWINAFFSKKGLDFLY